MIFSKPHKTVLTIDRKKLEILLSRIGSILELKMESLQKISIAFVTLSQIAKINEDFLGHKGSTDVISFDYRNSVSYSRDNHEIAAELIISYEKALIETKKRKNISFAEELTLYIVHGLLHIQGFDDLTTANRKKMRSIEKKIMSTLKIEFDLSKVYSIC